jgi:streptomycin 6-kinase
MKLPDRLIKNVMGVLKSQGSKWLDQLGTVVTLLAQKWQLTDIKIFENLSYNYVAIAYSAYYSSNVILKICLEDNSFMQEKAALTYYNGNGCVKLLDFDAQYKGLLLHAIQPGNSLKSFFPHQDPQAVDIAAGVMKKLHTQPINNTLEFPHMNTWLSLFDTLELPNEMKKPVWSARQLAQQLSQSRKEEYLLHGDLHHENILQNLNSWQAIDPKGVIGEPVYEIGAFMCNPDGLLQQPLAKEIILQRVEQFSRLLQFDRQRVKDACYVRIILAACWSVEDGTDYQSSLRCAELLHLK